MKAVTFVVIMDDKRITLTFIRDLSKNVDYKVYNTDVILFLDKVYFENEENASMMSCENITIIKPIMDSRFLEDSSPKPLSYGLAKNIIVFDTRWNKDLIYRKIKEVEVKSSTTYLNFEIYSREVLEFLEMPNNIRLNFCHTGKLDNKSFYRLTNWPSKMKVIKKSLEDLLAPKKMVKDKLKMKDVIRDIKDLSTYVTTEVKVWTEESISRYIYSRHEVMGVMQLMLGLAPDSSDVNMKDMFNYKGMDCHLTPDMVFKENETGKIYIVDVAVTRGSTRSKSDQKEMKYSLLAEQLSIHLSTEVIACAAEIGRAHV